MRHPETDGPLTQRSVRNANARRVLDAVREAGPVGRTEIAELTGLTLTTVHRLTADLRALDLVVSRPDHRPGREAGRGRPAPWFAFNAEARLVAGVDVGNETTRSGIADLEGRILAHADRPTSDVEADLVGSLASLVEGLLAESGRSVASLVAIGVGVPGVVVDDGRIVRTSLARPWEGLALGAGLRERLGRASVVAQDDHLAALAELRRGACAGRSDALVLNVGKGIGAGLIVDGQIYRGAHHAAGRVGRAPMQGPVGRVDVDRLLTADGLIEDYRRLGGRLEPSGARAIFAASAEGEPAAIAAVDGFADRLGELVATLIVTLDPEVVVLGGGIGSAYERLAPGIRAVVERTVPRPPEIVPSPLGVDAGVVGAVEAALDRADSWILDRIAGTAS